MFREVNGVVPKVTLDINDVNEGSLQPQETARLISEVLGDGIRTLYEEGGIRLLHRNHPPDYDCRARRLLQACDMLGRVIGRCEREPPDSGSLPVSIREVATLRSCISDFLPGERGPRAVYTFICWYSPGGYAIEQAQSVAELLVGHEAARHLDKRYREETVPRLCDVLEAKATKVGPAHVLLDHDTDMVVTGFPVPKMGKLDYYVAARVSSPCLEKAARVGMSLPSIGLLPQLCISSYENRTAALGYPQHL